MKLGLEDKKKLGILAGVGAAALAAMFYMYSELSTPDAPPPAPPVIRAASSVEPVRRSTGTSSRKPLTLKPGEPLDPTLHMEAMLVAESLAYSGTGRNIFSMNSAPVGPAQQVARVNIPQPVAPVRTGPVGPPPPPPIDLKFLGTETSSSGARRAFLLHGDDVFIASTGEVVQRRYRVIRIDARAIVMEDIANSNQQTLPLVGN